MTRPQPLEIDDRKPVYRVFAAAFSAATAFLVTAVFLGHFGNLAERVGTAALSLVAGVLAVSFARSPWRLRTALTPSGAEVEHTAWRALGKRTTLVPLDQVASVELIAKLPVRVELVTKTGTRLVVLRPESRRVSEEAHAASLKPRAEALARALGATLTVAG